MHEEGRVTTTTILRYKEAVVPFVKWCAREGVEPFTPDQWDDAIMDFKRFGGSEAVGMGVLTKSKFTLLLAAVEFRFPRMNGEAVSGQGGPEMLGLRSPTSSHRPHDQ